MRKILTLFSWPNVRTAWTNKFKSSALYWRYRHLFDSKVWNRYALDGSAPRRKFYAEVVLANKAASIFEFGCASGANLLSLERHLPVSYRFSFFGYDISSAAIRLAQKNQYSNLVKFDTALTTGDVELFLKNTQSAQFDLAIFDRVLYLLPGQVVLDHFLKFSRYYKNIVIDDFLCTDAMEKYDGKNYTARNYPALLEDLGFSILSVEATEHTTGQDIFLNAHAKRMCFKKTEKISADLESN